ncbi:hypothetical protein B7H23_01980 [Notoacmeibacter marinus]|uniref:CopG family transcriptional regulator n=1 Tax=Notoacmeibacter marinus TaxID=1876515 RepID=A0A231V0P4_9HYPH|nr:DUF411 domain-containing protein [Notoacmeibacter marinus]OXT01752.1 hypothetical protein B7H23_01980 [Notoacmeibacter marinus]
MKTIRILLPLTIAAAALALPLSTGAMAEETTTSTKTPTMHVVKSPTCGCCTAWADSARDEGFEVTIEHQDDYEKMKADAGVPGHLQSCHTATVAGYVVEGHVLFAAVRKLLSERPDIKGIAVPGMPAGSPGMGDDPKAVFDVMAFGGKAGEQRLYYKAGR